MNADDASLREESTRATDLLRGKAVVLVVGHRPGEVLIEFDDGTPTNVSTRSAAGHERALDEVCFWPCGRGSRMPEFSSADDVLDAVLGTAEFCDLDRRPGLNSKGIFGNVPLIPVITWGNANAVRLLIEAGADVNFCGERNTTPLHHAVLMRQLSIARMLIVAGADCAARDDEGKSPKDYCRTPDCAGLFEC